MSKIGILGGTFNPIHAGHLRMAVEAREALGLERVLLMPAGEPPHKPEERLLPFAQRLRLTELAVRRVAGLGASGLEGARPGPSYTFETLTLFRGKNPDDELTFILGGESFLGLDKWRRGLEIPNLCSLAVALRREAGKDAVEAFARGAWPGLETMAPGRLRFPSGTRLTILTAPQLEISSTDIRRRWRERRCLALLVPEAVEDLLERGGLDYDRAWGLRTGARRI